MTAPYAPAALRALADLIEQNDLPAPNTFTNGGVIDWYVLFGGDEAARVADIARRIGGTWAKNDPNESDHDSAYYQISRPFIDGLSLRITAYREQVCERVQVGEREVTREVPTATTTVTETEPVYEWRCVPLLAKAEATSA